MEWGKLLGWKSSKLEVAEYLRTLFFQNPPRLFRSTSERLYWTRETLPISLVSSLKETSPLTLGETQLQKVR